MQNELELIDLDLLEAVKRNDLVGELGIDILPLEERKARAYGGSYADRKLDYKQSHIQTPSTADAGISR